MTSNKDDIKKNELITPDIKLGIYKHYKGNLYEVIGTALHSETTEPLVVYKPLYNTKVSLWVRPYEMFFDSIEFNGKIVQRFEKQIQKGNK